MPAVQICARGPQKSIVCEMSFPPLHSEAAITAELRPLAEQLWQRLQQVRILGHVEDVAAAVGALKGACLLRMRTVVGLLSPGKAVVADPAGENSAMHGGVLPSHRGMLEIWLCTGTPVAAPAAGQAPTGLVQAFACFSSGSWSHVSLAGPLLLCTSLPHLFWQSPSSCAHHIPGSHSAAGCCRAQPCAGAAYCGFPSWLHGACFAVCAHARQGPACPPAGCSGLSKC